MRRHSLKNQSKKYRQSLYSLESGGGGVGVVGGMVIGGGSGTADTIRSRRSSRNADQQEGQPPLSPKPMTPRRVKRRSVMTRGTSNHNLNSDTHRSSRRHHRNGDNGGNGGGGTSHRSSTRSSRRKIQHQNPVTKLLDQQSAAAAAAGSYPQSKYYKEPMMTPALTISNLKSLHKSTDPIYYNMTSSSPLLTNSTSTTAIQQQLASYNHQSSAYQSSSAGHYNPTYQHSTPNLTQMSTNNQDLIDELYNNRPPSVRSSYSNFHGARSIGHLNNLNPAGNEGTTISQSSGGGAGAGVVGITRMTANNRGGQPIENVFSNLASGPPSSSPQAIPQVPQRGPNSYGGRSSVDLISNGAGTADRSMAFLSAAPPAYNLNYHTPPDSETTM